MKLKSERGVAVAISILLLLAPTKAMADRSPDWNLLADAIYQAEGGDRGELYGIHSIPYKDAADARAICIQVCRYRWWDWDSDRDGDFIKYLSKFYCPKNSKVWAKNVTWFYNKFYTQLEATREHTPRH